MSFWEKAIVLLAAAVSFAICLGRCSKAVEPMSKDTPGPVVVREATEPGPTVLVIAGIHGNEPAGVWAAEEIARWSITRGKLIVLSRANPAAIALNRRTIPNAPPGEEDLNRNFGVVDNRGTPQGILAQHIWNLVASYRPDWLVDLHESVNYRRVDPKRVGNTIIIYPHEETWAMVRRLLGAINEEISERDHRFVVLTWPARGSLARAAAEALGSRSLIIETTRSAPLPTRICQHTTLVRKLLEELQMVAGGQTSNDAPRPCEGQD